MSDDIRVPRLVFDLRSDAEVQVNGSSNAARQRQQKFWTSFRITPWEPQANPDTLRRLDGRFGHHVQRIDPSLTRPNDHSDMGSTIPSRGVKSGQDY